MKNGNSSSSVPRPIVNYPASDDEGSTSKSNSTNNSLKRKSTPSDTAKSKTINGDGAVRSESHADGMSNGLSLDSPASKKLRLQNGTAKSNSNGSSSPRHSGNDGQSSLKLKADLLQKQAQDLPVNIAADYLVKAILEQDTTIIMAETGSGKSTQIPQLLQKHRFALDHFSKGSSTSSSSSSSPSSNGHIKANVRTPSIAITQPRRLPCLSLATRVSEEMGVRLGQEVGYAVRFETKETLGFTNGKGKGKGKDGAGTGRKGETKVRYCTEGVLLREISGGNGSGGYGAKWKGKGKGKLLEDGSISGDVSMESTPAPSPSPNPSDPPSLTAPLPTNGQTSVSNYASPSPIKLSFYPNLPPNLLLRYDIIIVDEAHERTINTDFLLGTLKQIQKARKDLTRRVNEARQRRIERKKKEKGRKIEVKEQSAPMDVDISSEAGAGPSAFDNLAAMGDVADELKANGNGTSKRKLNVDGNEIMDIDPPTGKAGVSISNGILDNKSSGSLDELDAEKKVEEEDEELLRMDWGMQELRELKIVVMSATLQADLFSAYFDDAPICRVKGRNYQVAIKHLQGGQEHIAVDDYAATALKQCIQIHVCEPPGDILVFMPGQEDIEKLISGLTQARDEMPEKYNKILPLPLFRMMDQTSQNKVFLPAPNGTRKIIVSTNIAETGLTIDGIKYVVDSGKQKEKMLILTPAEKMEALITANCSQSSAQQRSGRAGRTANGTCYRLYTEKDYLDRPEMSTPEIVNANLASALLQLISVTDRPMQFPFLHAPDDAGLSDAIRTLFFLRAINISASGNMTLTSRGRRMLHYPVDPENAATLLESFELGSTAEILTILAIREAGSPIADTLATRDEAAIKRANFKHRDGDHLTYLNIYRAYEEAAAAEEAWGKTSHKDPNLKPPSAGPWLREHGLSGKNLREARKIRAQLSQLVREEGENPEQSAGEDTSKIMLAVLRGLTRNAARLSGNEQGREYRPCLGGLPVKIHPSSVIHGGLHAAIVYDELRLTSATYAHCVSIIEPSWIDDLNTHVNSRLQPLMGNDTKVDEEMVIES